MCQKPVAKAMTLASLFFTIIGLCIVWPAMTNVVPCPDGRLCPLRWRCCEHGCCAPTTQPARFIGTNKVYFAPEWYNNLPLFFSVAFLTVICGCAVWFCCRNHRQCSCMFACCVRRPTSNHDSAGSCYPPPHYSRCGSFHQAPPPYSEVTSKPDLYPLVITCAEGDNKGGGNYLMVHYFRNYVFRAPGSLSATSTAESLNSSFICNAANEANSIIPPPYSCSSTYDEWRGVGCGGSLLRSLSSLTEPRSPRGPPHSPRSPPRSQRGPPRSRTAPPAPPAPSFRPFDMSPEDAFQETLITSPVQPMDSAYDLELDLIDYDRLCGLGPRLVPSPPVQQRSPTNDDTNVFEHDFERLRHLYSCKCPSPDTIACESPPQPTSPTQTSRDSTLRRPSDEKRHKRPETIKKNPKARKTSLYMPLSSAYPVKPSRISPSARMSSRSAPATPCGSLVPNLLALTQRVSASRHGSKSSKLEEENDLLLSDEYSTRLDHKF